ncbi:lipid II:glycine glycyltransferase FemX [Leucobacter chromiiresistens]|uniref:FemAB family protein n=1 Tax=Leucobacter chromiiresistens TaxID=1079994 RepID=A0A1H1BS76_9MICO|nr:peptidoglycan bridge formation glycyltransferase FemA/FemB family protein [Leucobacter chromiiresistens]SDQ54778.1 FemAB family protein [Leucobacter chromiiresistens]
MTTGSASAVARFASDAERAEWNARIAANPGGGEVWAGEQYLDVKRAENGYRDFRVIVERGARPPIAVGVLAKRAPLLGWWWHLPAGPAGADAAEVLETAAAVAALARASGAFLLKIEPRIGREAIPDIHEAGYRDAVRIIPNPSTVLVDVSGSEDEVFARIGKKARNAINRARRDGISVSRVEPTAEHSAQLFGLLQETAEGRFVLRSERYYREFWQRFSQAGVGQMFLAHRDGALVAGAYAMALGAKTTYKDGASMRAKTAYGASHALQWEVMRWANERGALVHDLCGAPPSDRADDREHPLFGVGQFKRSFSPQIVDYAGAFDLPLRPLAYRIWEVAGDRIARRVSLAVRKDPYY